MYRKKLYGCLIEKIKFNKSSFGLEDGCDVDTKTAAMLKPGACRLTITLIMVAFTESVGVWKRVCLAHDIILIVASPVD